MKKTLVAILLCLISPTLSAQEATLKGKLERYVAGAGQVSLYVMGQVDTKEITPSRDGSFTVKVDLWERNRVLLFWDDGVDHDWSCTFYLEPDATTKLTVLNGKRSTTSNTQKATTGNPQKATREVHFEGAGAGLSHYTNLCYQTFEREMLLDSLHLVSLTDFRQAQDYIETVLQPLGEALLNIGQDDTEETSSQKENDTEATEDNGREEEANSANTGDEEFTGADAESADIEEGDDGENPEATFAEEERQGLDMQQLEAEFRYAMLAERRGQHMADDPAFKAYIADIDTNDSEQAAAIANLVQWQTVATPKRYAPLRDEAAQLAALEQVTDDEDVRNAVADIVMQRFMLRVQMGANPADKRYRPLYETLRRVCTDRSYNDFIDTQLLRMEHPELFKDESNTPPATVLDDIPDVE